MRKVIEYHYLKSDHLLASPEYDHEEIVEAATMAEIHEHVAGQKDQYGHPFKMKESMGYQFISNCGGVKIKDYKEPVIIHPKIKKL